MSEGEINTLAEFFAGEHAEGIVRLIGCCAQARERGECRVMTEDIARVLPLLVPDRETRLFGAKLVVRSMEEKRSLEPLEWLGALREHFGDMSTANQQRLDRWCQQLAVVATGSRVSHSGGNVYFVPPGVDADAPADCRLDEAFLAQLRPVMPMSPLSPG